MLFIKFRKLFNCLSEALKHTKMSSTYLYEKIISLDYGEFSTLHSMLSMNMLGKSGDIGLPIGKPAFCK